MKIHISIIILYSIVTCFAQPTQKKILWPTLADSPWPMIKHDPQFTGRSPYKGPQTPTIIWTADMKDGIFSGPVVDTGGNLYFGSYYQLNSADHFYSFTSDGELRWDYNTGSNRPPQTGILIDSSNTIYFGSLDKYFYALNPDGTFKWKYETSAPIVELAIPNIDLEGRLYITNGLGELYSINPDGTLNWKVKYENGFFADSPVFSPEGNTIYIAGRDSNIFAINLDGSLKWKFKCGKIFRSPIIDSYGNIYFIPKVLPQYLYSLFPNSNVRWKYGVRSVAEVFSIPTIDYEGNIYFIAIDSTVFPNRALISLNFDGYFRWSYIFEEYEDFWQPLICDSEGTVYLGSTYGKFYFAISTDGKLKWKLPLNDYQVDNTGSIAKDGTLYLGVHKSSLATNQQKTLIAIRDTGTTSVGTYPKVFNFQLEQNYPNPFNPTTTISYTLPSDGRATIKIFDILGREVKTLVKDYKTAGSYSAVWNSQDIYENEVSSGIYFYNIKFKDNSVTKKMLLVR
ncbi:MAG: T9SS type A sorting domain-containing protein [Ignavibacteriales bacterium]|nr:T9SS type A sorting domain-containing protein [Ignavibacteriales bacterium]